MAYIARDIQLNGNGRFSFDAGVDNVIQKVQKFFIPLMGSFIGQKTAVPLGNALGAVRIMGIIRDAYLQTQASAININTYDNDDLVDDIDSITVKQIVPTEIEFSFRVIQPTSSTTVSGTLPVGTSGIAGVAG